MTSSSSWAAAAPRYISVDTEKKDLEDTDLILTYILYLLPHDMSSCNNCEIEWQLIMRDEFCSLWQQVPEVSSSQRRKCEEKCKNQDRIYKKHY